jgi:hypothetical protein
MLVMQLEEVCVRVCVRVCVCLESLIRPPRKKGRDDLA